MVKTAAKRKPRKSDKRQSERFKEAARKLDADDAGELFEKVFKKIVPSQKPQKY
jgi:hypothetical protein